MSHSDTRLSLLTTWLNQFFNQTVTPELICGDASFRRYFRLKVQHRSYIVADSPIELVPIEPFITIAKAYKEAGLLVPEVVHFSSEQGFVLQTDVGEKQLLSVLTLDNVHHYYQQALDILPVLANVTHVNLPTNNENEHLIAQSELTLYDSEFVLRELGIFSEWLIEKHLQYELNEKEKTMLNNSFSLLVDNVLAQPKVGMHRDFHSRNLLLNHDLDETRLAVIDFQDAVLGPITYDAVSLLRDCYVRWPDDVVNELAHYHYQLMVSQGLLANWVNFDTYKQWFDLMGIQRHLKAAGIFARLNIRDGKPGYMTDIPLTLQYIIDIAKQYDELVELSDWIAKVVLPKVLEKTQHYAGV